MWLELQIPTRSCHQRLPQGVGASGDGFTLFLVCLSLIFSNLIHALLFFIIFMSVVYLSRDLMGVILFVFWCFSVYSISLFLFLSFNHLSGNLAFVYSL